jgi:signal peptidase II
VITAFNSGFIALLITVLVDQVTKSIVVYRVGSSDIIPIIPHFNVIYVRNKGISFGMMNNGDTWQLAIILSIVFLLCGFLVYQLFQSKRKISSVCLGAVLGGALGNLVDRVVHGAVIDFIDFYIADAHFLNLHIKDWHWPTFNIADSAIVMGVIGLVILYHKSGGSKTPQAKKGK